MNREIKLLAITDDGCFVVIPKTGSFIGLILSYRRPYTPQRLRLQEESPIEASYEDVVYCIKTVN